MSATSPFLPNVRLAVGWRILSPRLETVVRNTPDPSVTVTQRKFWALPEGEGFFASLPRTTVMIRNEYDDLLLAILSSLQRQQVFRQVSLRDAAFKLSVTPRVPDPPECTTEPPPSLDEAFKLSVTPRVPDLSECTTYPNPFLDPDYRNLYHKRGVLIITGLPGIGKTSFLALIFHLRVAANLPTLYMATENSAIIFKNEQLGELKNPTDVGLALNMPPETWCLIDSTRSLTAVPGAIQQNKMFIVQATSPRGDRMEYAKKLRSQICLMRPWSLEELIIGSSLQEFPVAEAEIKFFFERFGGSARDVFLYAYDPNGFERDIDAAASKLGADEIESLITSTIFTLAVPGQEGHALLSAFPLGNHDRREFQIRSPSQAMYEKVLKRISTSRNAARHRLYTICSGVDSPGCKDLFNQHYHDFLLAGGTWGLHVLQKPDGVQGRVVSWKGLLQPSGSYLYADRVMSIGAAKDVPVQPATISQIQFGKTDEPPEGQPLRKGVYYRPTQRTFATFDSFYVLNQNHVLVFQASVAKKHDVKKTGVEWLKDRKVKKITYIYVTPSNFIGCPQVQVPVALEDSFNHLYYMQLYTRSFLASSSAVASLSRCAM
ncbi:hypothetical protein K438DRAFT_2011012 [Mycena galopus ATCC 62051]|nr:hypothetical protein K438DRAFT_2011012 [Mycena galopus ATCC 62051]